MLVRLTMAVSRVGGRFDGRIHVMGPDGHVMSRVDLICEDEETARERASSLHRIAWSNSGRARKIAEYHPRH
jgi:hypothetical protein